MSFFLEEQFAPFLSSGTKGRTAYNTLVVGNPTNGEVRYQMQGKGYYKVTIDLRDRSADQMQAIQDFWDNVMGKTYGFRWRNRLDYQATAEQVVPISGTTGQLTKAKTYGGVTSQFPIKKPDLVKPITLTRDGVAFPSGGNWSLNTSTGVVTYTADQTGHAILWTGEYDIPVRFDIDTNNAEWTDFNIFDWTEISLLEYAV